MHQTVACVTLSAREQLQAVDSASNALCKETGVSF